MDDPDYGSLMLVRDGVSKSLDTWSEELGLDRGLIQRRLRYGWTDEEALIPLGARRKYRVSDLSWLDLRDAAPRRRGKPNLPW